MHLPPYNYFITHPVRQRKEACREQQNETVGLIESKTGQFRTTHPVKETKQ
jgi:hypothetical protein